MTKHTQGTSVPHANPKNSAQAALANIDGYLDALSYDPSHPWRTEIAAALAEPVAVDAPAFSPPGANPYFHNASNATSELFNLVKDGLPRSAANADDRLRLKAVQAHAENEIQSIADGLSAIGSLVSLSGQVADDAGIPGITLIRLGILINQLADTLDAVHELRNDAAFTLSQSAAGAA